MAENSAAARKQIARSPAPKLSVLNMRICDLVHVSLDSIRKEVRLGTDIDPQVVRDLEASLAHAERDRD